MTQHKWHKEIKAWADGAEIEWFNHETQQWRPTNYMFEWNTAVKYRIKPQPKEPQYLYVWESEIGIAVTSVFGDAEPYKYLGKIKLEVDDEPVHSD